MPPQTCVIQRSGDEVVLEPVGDSLDPEMPDVFVGRLPVVYWNQSEQRPQVADLHVPAPPPFAEHDEERMWRDVRESLLPIPQPLLAQGRATGGRVERINVDELELENLREALAAALSLLRKWPTTETTERIWRPIEARGGREDAFFTERFGQRLTGTRRGSGLALVDRTARRRAQMQHWGSAKLSSVSSALAATLHEHAAVSGLDEGTTQYGSRLLRELALTARPAVRAVDPPTSSWPPNARATYQAILRAFVDLQSNREDAARGAPLCRLWLLYESWVAATTLRVLRELLGEPTRHPKTSPGEWAATWERAGRRVALLIQPVFGATPRRVMLESSTECRSLTSDLIPDVVVAVSTEGQERPTLSVIDAKKRGVSTAMSRADLAVAASKYLWGLRWVDEAEGQAGPTADASYAISNALIATSATAPKMHFAEGLIGAIELRPTLSTGEAALRAHLRSWVDPAA